MAWANGTATDFIDFLRKLRGFASGALDSGSATGFTAGSGTVPAGDQWEVLTNGSLMPGIPSSGFATDGEFYLKGQGSDPDDEIIVGIKTYRNVGNNIFGFRVRGYTQFNDTLDYFTLPGTSPSCFVALDDAIMNFYFRVNSRRIIAIARIGTTDIMFQVGFPLQVGTRGQYPYPLLISGSQKDETQNFQVGHYGQSSLPDPCENGAFLRWVDGTWQQIRHYTSTSDQRGQARETTGNPGPSFTKIWPLRDVTTTIGDEFDTGANEENLFEQWSNTSLQISNSEITDYTLFDCVIHMPQQVIARLDGIYVVNGLGLVAGDDITVGGDVYDVFKNTWRSEAVDFYAVLRA